MAGLGNNQIKGGGNRQLKLLRNNLNNAEQYMKEVNERMDRIFVRDDEPIDKRAFEMLGSLISTITGVPSAGDHR